MAVCGVTALHAPDNDVCESRESVASPAAARLYTKTWRDMDIASYVQTVAGGRAVTLRLDPNLPETAAYTVERVVDGDPSRIIVYVPWVHDHPDAPPMPEPYLASLRSVLITLSATATFVGVEGSGAGDDLREEFSAADEDLEPYDASVCAQSDGNAALCAYLVTLQAEIAAAFADGTERLLRAIATATTVPIGGIEDTTIPASELDDSSRDHLRSEAAVQNTLHELDVRGGGRAVLLFGMAHHQDIEDAVRRVGASLDLVCVPHLCRASVPRRRQ
ncbi:MAG: hypothetical protein Q7S02_03090 [bacterium]|nr:hypothetical protein [bacterium]